MRAKWLLTVAAGIAGIGGTALAYLYPTETTAIIESTLGVSAYTAAEIIITLTAIGVVVLLFLFAAINIRDYYRRNPTKTVRVFRRSLWGALAVVGSFMAISMGFLSVLLTALYTGLTLLGAAFVSTTIFTTFCCASLAIRSIQNSRMENPPRGVRSVTPLLVLTASPYYFIVVQVAYYYLTTGKLL